MTRTTVLASSALVSLALVFLLPATALADPLHPIARDGYWHHESNFVFPARLAGFTRAGAPQELDGSETVTAYYAQGEGDARIVVQVSVAPVRAGSPPAPAADTKYTVDHAGWRVTVQSRLLAEDSRLEGLIAALPISRLGEIDTRCPNPGCGD
ncbi:MAG TPA: hypothetical protein VMF52_16365 [Steroidobacteraceae bacterium]|nr:hypothetical protein [Steroidobacteraceae bacterium]